MFQRYKTKDRKKSLCQLNIRTYNDRIHSHDSDHSKEKSNNTEEAERKINETIDGGIRLSRTHLFVSGMTDVRYKTR